MAKILHTGDFHLDSAFSGLDFSRSEKARNARRELAARIMRSAKSEGCDIILISGDLFDSSYVSKETDEMLTALFKELEIPVVISPGNHDPYIPGGFYDSANLSENVYVFKSEEVGVFNFPDLNLSVFGYAFTSAAHPGADLYSLPESECGEKILLAHTELDVMNSKYAPVGRGDIAAAGFKYAALGHIHKEPQMLLENCSYISYCGFPEGRGFDEIGKGGAWMIETIPDSNRINVKRCLYSRVRYEIEPLDVTEISDTAALAEAVTALAKEKGFDDHTRLRIVLHGFLDANFKLDNRLLITQLQKNNAVAELEIKNETIPDFSGMALEKDLSIRGEIYRVLLPELTGKDPQARQKAKRALNLALRAIEGDYHGTEAGVYENTFN